MVGGIFTSFALELLVYPAIYELWRRKTLTKMNHDSGELPGETKQHGPESGILIAT
jgi:hypothetical protein